VRGARAGGIGAPLARAVSSAGAAAHGAFEPAQFHKKKNNNYNNNNNNNNNNGGERSAAGRVA